MLAVEAFDVSSLRALPKREIHNGNLPRFWHPTNCASICCVRADEVWNSSVHQLLWTWKGIKRLLNALRDPMWSLGATGTFLFSSLIIIFRVDISRNSRRVAEKTSRSAFFQDISYVYLLLPNPEDPTQAGMIRDLPFVENVIRDFKVEVASHEMLNVSRKALKNRAQKLDISGTCIFHCFGWGGATSWPKVITWQNSTLMCVFKVTTYHEAVDSHVLTFFYVVG